MYDVIIVGAGPAGLTAAIYLKRARKNILVLEAKTYGGQIINASKIDNYPAMPGVSGFEFATNLYNQVKDNGTPIRFEKVVKINDGDVKEVITEKDSYKAKAVILATGSESRRLGIPKEEELTGKGVSYCATCDGAFYRGQDVAVVGGGDNALDEALYLSDVSNLVYLIHRKDSFRANEGLQEKVKNKDNIKIIYNSNVVKLNGEKKLEGIEIKNNDGALSSLDVSGLFVAVGRIPENEGFRSLVKMDKAGYIEAGEDCLTNVSGIFACGDNRVKTVRQLVTASSDGANAAMGAIKYINRKN